MAVASTPGREYNRRTAINKGLRVGRSPTEIIQFFDIQDQPFMTLWQNIVLQQSNKSSSTLARKRIKEKLKENNLIYSYSLIHSIYSL